MLADFAPHVVSLLSLLTLLGQVIALVLIVSLFFGSIPSLRRWVSAHGLLLMLIVAVTGMAGSLYFSDIAQWTPCKLCWFQRIFLYPQVAMLGLAVWKKDRTIAPYIFLLSVIGALIAALHYGEQVSAALFPAAIDPNIPCDTTGASCRSTPFFHFGYITITLMAATAFLLNLLGSVVVMVGAKK